MPKTHDFQDGANTYRARFTPAPEATLAFYLLATAAKPAPALADVHGNDGWFIGRYYLRDLTHDWWTGAPRARNQGITLDDQHDLAITGEALTSALEALTSPTTPEPTA